MKKLLCVFIAALLLFGLAACSEKNPKEEEKNKAEPSVESLSAEELYAKGIEKNKALTSAKFLTEIFLGGEKIEEITTVRVRKGYDGFSYSRSGREYFAFADGAAYIKTEAGAFTAPSTSRAFAEYIDSYLFPVYGFSPQFFAESIRAENFVSYEISNAEFLALFSSILPEASGTFSPSAISGKAEFNKEAILTAEEFTVSGTLSGSGEAKIEVKTKLIDYRSETIQPSLPEESETFLQLTDIRLPQMIALSCESLFALPEAQVTLVRSEKFDLGGKIYSLNRDINLYKKGSADSLSYYRSLQSLKNEPEKAEESRFLQQKYQNGSGIFNEYNLITAEKLSEGALSSDFAWQEDILAILPALHDFSEMTVEEDGSIFSIRFRLTQTAANQRMAEAAALFGFSATAAEAGEVSGTLLIDQDRNLITALSYVVKTSAVCGEESGSFSGEFSITLDQTESVALPEIQIPTPTTPGMQDPNGHGPEC